MNAFNKHILRHLTLFLVFFILTGRTAIHAQTADTTSDDIKISLLTCSPHQEVYSLYGHTALHVVDKKRGLDVAVNYGVFNFDKPLFTLRFVFGLTDYEMGVVPYQFFCEEYRYHGCEVKEQEFNLTAAEKDRIIQALAENNKEENRVYRYNYFYDNCTTRARDIIIDNLDGKVTWNTKVPEGTTYRTMIHEKTKGHPWAQLGNDLLLGVGADRPLTVGQYLFLPAQTMEALDAATVTSLEKDSTGREHDITKRLIAKDYTIMDARNQTVEDEFPLTPLQVSAILCLLFMAVTFVEWKKKLCLWIFDAVLMLLQGIGGLILTAMIFSQHPTVNINIQILLLNPLPLLFGWQALCRYRRGERHWLWLTECLLFSLCMVLSSFGVQWLDPAIKILACTLVIRYGMKLKVTGK